MSHTVSVNVGMQTVTEVVRCAVGRISHGHFRCHDYSAFIGGDAHLWLGTAKREHTTSSHSDINAGEMVIDSVIN